MIGQRIYRRGRDGSLSAYPIGWIGDQDDTHYLVAAMKGDRAQLIERTDPTTQVMVWLNLDGRMRLVTPEVWERLHK